MFYSEMVVLSYLRLSVTVLYLSPMKVIKGSVVPKCCSAQRYGFQD